MRLTIMILMLTSLVVRIRSTLTFFVSVRIAVLTPVLKERTVSMEAKIATNRHFGLFLFGFVGWL
ncbi:unnamed protein product [Hymenolepis diminuta]|uniref:Uncharacterized protein n=1 Tax=Hymenolepis diminuta TaxID=6216 RepID=A0A564XYD3_HYMDI|nr:unnamed protein product [Hymenolepis diminuta]